MAVAEQVEVLDPAPTLEALAETVNREHSLVEKAGAEVLEHAILAGEALLQIRLQIRYGQWGRWLEKNFNGHQATAGVYMRIARHRDIVMHRATSITSAARLLSGAPALPKAWFDQALKDEIDRLRAEGQTFEAIASVLGISTQTVRLYLRPKRRKELNAQRRGKSLKETDGAVVKRAGGKLPGVRTVVLRALAELQKELDLEQDRETRAEIATLMQRFYDVEDQLKTAAYARIAAREAARRNIENRA